MKNRTKKTKALYIRALAWVLCLVCLCAAVPTVAIATGDEAETEPVVETTEAVQEQAEATLYERLMAATSCEGICAILDSADTADVEALTYDELTAIIAYVETLEDDGCRDALLEDLAVLRDGEATVIGQGGGGQGGGGQGGGGQGGQGYTLSMSHYDPDTEVYYMVSTANKTKATDQNTITSVTLAGNSVPNPNSVTPSYWNGGPLLSSCYPGLQKNGNDTTASLVITPAVGYYVTRVVVACTGGQSNTTPFSCNTWNANAAYEQSFEASSVGTVTVALPSRAFGHSSDSGKYCILIVVAPIPTPLYVEYDYGTIGSLLGDAYDSSPFANADDWTDDNTGNVYKPSGDTSDGGVKTEDTQFKYTYQTTSGMTDADKAAAVQNWKHTTNTVTDEAKTAAASVGYYFTGWQYVYYTAVDVTGTPGSYNNYKYDFSSAYSGAAYVGENTSLTLITNVRLVAQWAPIQLKVTKTVTGLNSISEFATYSNTYKITLQKRQEDGTYIDVATDVGYTISGDGTLTYTFAASGAEQIAVITPGTYKVVETGSYNLTGTTENAYCTTSYPFETVVVVGTDGAAQELKVLNTYSSKPATYDLTVKKTLSGDMYSKTKEFAFTVTYKDVNGDTKTGTFNLGMGGTHTIEGIQVNTTVTVSEDPDGYDYTCTGVTDANGNVTYTALVGESSVSFTMPASDTTVVFNNELNGDINTGVVLEALPYVLILAVAGAAALLLLRKRRYDDEV